MKNQSQYFSELTETYITDYTDCNPHNLTNEVREFARSYAVCLRKKDSLPTRIVTNLRHSSQKILDEENSSVRSAIVLSLAHGTSSMQDIFDILSTLTVPSG